MVRVFTRITKRDRSLSYLFINRFTRKGKKDFLIRIFFKVIFILKRKKNRSINLILTDILKRIKPVLSIKPKFAAGLIFFIPTFIHKEKETAMGMNWLNKALRQRTGRSFFFKLLEELNLCLSNKSTAIVAKQDLYKIILHSKDSIYLFRKKKK